MSYAVVVDSETEDRLAEHPGFEIPVTEAISRVRWIAFQMMAQVTDNHDLRDLWGPGRQLILGVFDKLPDSLARLGPQRDRRTPHFVFHLLLQARGLHLGYQFFSLGSYRKSGVFASCRFGTFSTP